MCLCLGLLLAADTRAADFTFDELAELVRSRSVATVEQALAVLPAELRANYALVFASRSLQDAAPAAPRAILYGADGRFIVTFNGDAGERGYDVLETMQFDERSNSFHFREMSFPSAGSPKISEDNPGRCTACHGRPARPIWDTLPTWPGVYGERYRAGLSKPESIGMQAFLARQTQDPRYRYLIGARRFGDRATYVASAATLYSGQNFEPPNARLSVLLATLNVRSLVADLAAQPAFAPHRYVLLAAAAGNCGDLKSFFPASMRPASAQAMADYGQSAAAAAGAQQEAAKRLRRASNAESYRGGAATSDPMMLRFIAERLVGMPSQRWSLALEEGTYDLAAPEGALSFEQLLFERLACSEPDLRELRAFRSFGATDALCAELSRRSERELTAFYGPAGSERMRAAASTPAGAGEAYSPPRLLDHCIECHTGDVGPALPFGDPEALGLRLRAGGYAHGRLLDEILYRLAPEAGAARMPRDINATPAERRDLEDYFVRLATP